MLAAAEAVMGMLGFALTSEDTRTRRVTVPARQAPVETRGVLLPVTLSPVLREPSLKAA